MKKLISCVMVSLCIWAVPSFAMPDLVINRALLIDTVSVQKRQFGDGGCELQEGCIRAPGIRKILRVDLGIANIGTTDLVIGDPGERPDLFQMSPCHDHMHINGLAKYRLLNLRFQPVTAGRKQGFCLRDNYQFGGHTGPSHGYTCDYQGITAGWQDVYDETSPCQWIDITGVPPGKYYLEVRINPKRVFREANYNNNRQIILIKVPRYVPLL